MGKKVFSSTQRFGLLDKVTGEVLEGGIWYAKSQGGRFMKVWQGTGWEQRIDALQGASLKVLLHLINTSSWNNQIPGTRVVAKRMGKQQSHISRAYAELMKANFIYRNDGMYQLNPYFCWKGSDKEYEHACRESETLLLR